MLFVLWSTAFICTFKCDVNDNLRVLWSDARSKLDGFLVLKCDLNNNFDEFGNFVFDNCFSDAANDGLWLQVDE